MNLNNSQKTCSCKIFVHMRCYQFIRHLEFRLLCNTIMCKIDQMHITYIYIYINFLQIHYFVVHSIYIRERFLYASYLFLISTNVFRSNCRYIVYLRVVNHVFYILRIYEYLLSEYYIFDFCRCLNSS